MASKQLNVAGVVAVLVVAVLAVVAVWTGDARWGYTAAIVGTTTGVLTFAVGLARCQL